MGEQIKVALPLSMNLSGALLAAIGAVWPEARIVTDTGEDRYMVIDPNGEPQAPDPERVAEAAEAAAAANGPDDEQVNAFLSSLRDGSFGMSAPEWYSKMMLGALREILDESDAPNYVEQTLHDPDTGEVYTVTVGRPGGRTPHQLRTAAEERAAAAEAALAEIAAANGVTRSETGWSTPTGELSVEAAAALNDAVGAED